ncbi:hypothetical protein [Christiangramia sp. SM2212]|uniref:STAS/SEC14 domain-containing protein n=1 Tax=Christiangramia sediminicola TaxID=3073267 RepID=A0ABU1EL19_9FLAO|nr:hypothetical protein [Christiangramia sp. SM2212]MDR5589080.1 hypothetical protein [Christiangramia sp. SM2212]
MDKPLQIKELSFAKLKFYKYYVIAVIDEDTVVSDTHFNELIQNFDERFGDEGYVYIANRENNYNVNPIYFKKLEEISKMKALAVVNHNTSSIEINNFEKHFCPIPYVVFDELENAVAWAEDFMINKAP